MVRESGVKTLPWYSFAEAVCANLLPLTNGNKMRAYAIAQAVIRNELADARRQGDQRYAAMLFLALHLVERAADDEASRIVADRPVPYELTPAGLAAIVNGGAS